MSSGMSSIYHVNVLVKSAIAYRIEELPLNLVAGYLLAVLDLALNAVLMTLALLLTIIMPTFLNHRVAFREAPGAAQHLLGSDGLVSTDFL